jgi:hypothetical protein
VLIVEPVMLEVWDACPEACSPSVFTRTRFFLENNLIIH